MGLALSGKQKRHTKKTLKNRVSPVRVWMKPKNKEPCEQGYGQPRARVDETKAHNEFLRISSSATCACVDS